MTATRQKPAALGELDVQRVQISDLKLNDANPRTIQDPRFADLKHSLQQEPDMLWVRPVLALPDGLVIAGNMRVRAAMDLGWESIPAAYVDLDPTRAKQWIFRDNHGYGEWDPELRDAILAELADTPDVDLRLTGFPQEELDELIPDYGDVGDVGAHHDGVADRLERMSVTLGEPRHTVIAGQVWRIDHHWLCAVSIYDGWPTYVPLLQEDRLLVPYPSPIVPLTARARNRTLVMVQPDGWLAGHLLDKYEEVHGAGHIELEAP